MGSSAQTPVIKSSRIRTALKWLLVVWLIAWALIGSVYALIHVAIVPRIDNWRADLETKLTETVGLPVQIAQLRGAASGWTTRFQIDQIQIQARDGGSALSIGNIDVQFSLASLWQLQLENLQVNNADLLVERDGTGHWSVAGIGIAADTEQSVPAWLDWVLAQPRMGVQNATVRLVDRMGESQAWTFETIDANLINGRRSHDISLAMTPPAALGDRLNVAARMRSSYFENSLTDFAAWEGQIDTQLPRVQFQALRAMLVQLLPPDSWPTQDKLKLPKQWVNGGEGSWGLSLVVGRGLRVQSVRNDIGMRDLFYHHSIWIKHTINHVIFITVSSPRIKYLYSVCTHRYLCNGVFSNVITQLIQIKSSGKRIKILRFIYAGHVFQYGVRRPNKS